MELLPLLVVRNILNADCFMYVKKKETYDASGESDHNIYFLSSLRYMCLSIQVSLTTAGHMR